MSEGTEAVDVSVLTPEIVSEGLSQAAETTDGEGWAFTCLKVPVYSAPSLIHIHT